MIVIVIVGWFVGLGFWANSQLTRDDVLSGAANTPGTTYLLAGSDSRGDGTLEGDTTTGQRADTLMLVHVAENGHSTLVSLPRDTLVDIPGQGTNKLNAAYAFGGAPLLVQTVENLTGLTVDHYVEVGFAGVENIVNAVGTVNVCLPQDVNDPEARLNLTAGCHDVDGATALAFVRVRHFDPTADLGRQTRQQEFMKSLTGSVMEPATFVNPLQQASLAKAVTGSITIDQDSNIVDLARLGLAFRSATGPDGTVGQIPWINPNYASSVGSAIQIDPAAVRSYFESVRDGTLPASSAAE
ncbi:LCP family protein [Micrococcales bacterium 31B]|nr:LCP family protein [Micrococcales bacterium 31B]